MKKILLLTTGGTIASLPGQDGLAPAMTADAMLQFLPEHGRSYHVDCRMLMQLDSSSMQPEDWPPIARAVNEAYDQYDGFVITHGTDTMSYTAAALSYMLQHLRKPVVLTGSQIPLAFSRTDATKNLSDALRFACEPAGGVFVVFDGKVIQGTRSVKWRTRSRDAFKSVNAPYAAYVNGDKVLFHPDSGSGFGSAGTTAASASTAGGAGEEPAFRLDDSLCPDVALVKLHPGTKPQLFDFLKAHYKGIVIEVFGLGGLPASGRNVIPKLQELLRDGIAIAVVTQCPEEDTDLTVYEVGRLVSDKQVIMAQDMTTEATVAKLMWVLGRTSEPALVKHLMETPMAGDRTVQPSSGCDSHS